MDKKDTIYNTTTIRLSLWDRIKVLFGKPIITNLEIATGHDEAIIIASKATSYVPALFPKKSKGEGWQAATNNPNKH